MASWRFHLDAWHYPAPDWKAGERVALAILILLAVVGAVNLLLAFAALADDPFYPVLFRR
jgi:hypothetical protein